MQQPARLHFLRRGSTILEAMVAVAIVAVFLVGLYQMNGRALSLLKSGLEGVSGTRILVSTIEQVRAATWDQATNANYLVSVLNSLPPPGHMANVAQTVELNTIPPTASAKIAVTKAANGTVSITSAGDATLPTRIAATVDVTITWKTTFNSITHTRMMSAYLSPSGILGRNQ